MAVHHKTALFSDSQAVGRHVHDGFDFIRVFNGVFRVCDAEFDRFELSVVAAENGTGEKVIDELVHVFQVSGVEIVTDGVAPRFGITAAAGRREDIPDVPVEIAVSAGGP